MQTHIPRSPAYNQAIRQSVILVCLFVGLSSLVLDGGTFLRIALITALGYLVGVCLIAIRRPQNPSVIDLWLLRWGFIPLWLAAQVFVPYGQRLWEQM